MEDEVHIPDYVGYTAGPNPGQGLLLDQRTFEIIRLNVAGEVVWKGLGRGSVSEAIKYYEQQTGRAPARAASEVSDFVSRLLERGLLCREA